MLTGMTPITKGQHILIPGAGLVGSLAGIWLARQGFKVTMMDKRTRPGSKGYDQSRSINLAVSHRAWKALAQIGLEDAIKEIALPMEGRIVHDTEGRTQFMPYGREGQAIYSVSRGKLNEVLNNHAAAEPNIEIHYQSKAIGLDVATHTVKCTGPEGTTYTSGDVVLGADGAFSVMRQVLQVSDRFDFSQNYIAHGYQEFTLPPGPDGDWALNPGGLHIWPRKSFMLIALPNTDKSFTCTLFLSWQGAEDSFEALKNAAHRRVWFQENFPDFCQLVPDFTTQAEHNVVSSLVTIRCFPWHSSRALLLGDAAHALVPFYGQGMNAGFEDVDVLMSMLPNHTTWEGLFHAFERRRKPDADAIADLALANFIEMRDKVADPVFLFHRKLSNRLATLLPDKWVPLYTLVSFTSTPYAQALATGKEQERILRRIANMPGVHNNYQDDAWLLEALHVAEFAVVAE